MCRTEKMDILVKSILKDSLQKHEALLFIRDQNSEFVNTIMEAQVEPLKVMLDEVTKLLSQVIRELVNSRNVRENENLLTEWFNSCIDTPRDTPSTCRFLVQNGAYPMQEKTTNFKIFAYMIRRNDIDTVKMLISRTKDSNLPRSGIQDLLTEAFRRQCVEIADLLLGKYSNMINLTDNFRTCLNLATKLNSCELIELVLKYVRSPRCLDKHDCSVALKIACRLSNLELAQLILKRNVDVNGICDIPQKMTPLQLACSYYIGEKSLRLIEFLLKSKADVNKMDKYHETPLYSAIQYPEIINLLIQFGANVDTQRKEFGNETPLHRAASHGYTKSLKTLIDAGANVLLCDGDGRSAYHHCLKSYDHEGFKLLMKRQIINVNGHRDQNGHSVMRHLVFRHHEDLYQNEDHQICKMTNVLLHYGGDLRESHNYLCSIREVDIDDIDNIGDSSSSDDYEDGDDLLINIYLECPEITYFTKVFFLGFKNFDYDLGSMALPSYARRGDKIWKLCKKELEQLKEIVLGSYPRTSLYDLFFFNRYKMAKWAKNEKLTKLLEQNDNDFENQFPQYGLILNFRVKRGAVRHDLMNSAIDKFASIIAYHLPEYCAEKIFKYFNEDDLQEFNRMRIDLKRNSKNCRQL